MGMRFTGRLTVVWFTAVVAPFAILDCTGSERAGSGGAHQEAVGELYQVLRAPPVTDPIPAAPTTALPVASPPAPSIVFVVMDTVRADHLSLCGYERPTSPTLESLRARGAAVSCDAYAPSDWTMPSHASYFTGLLPTEHGANYASHAEVAGHRATVAHGLKVTPMRADVPTLAGQLAADGYQTVMVAANPILGGASGLSRGFQVVRTRPKGTDRRKDWVTPALKQTLATDVDPKRPLFLMVNLVAAHDPWGAPPSGVPWRSAAVGPLDPVRFAHQVLAYWSGHLDPAKVPALRRQYSALYDYGVWREDHQLGVVLDTLEHAGWLGPGFRVVITSDHGEMVIEHGLWRHLFVYEGNIRVPLVVYESAAPPSLPAALPAIVSHDLVRTGRLPATLPPIVTESIPNPDLRGIPRRFFRPAVSLHTGTGKLVWMDDHYYRFDLATDPGEMSPHPLDATDPGRSELARYATRVAAGGKPHALAPGDDAELRKQLESLGYLHR